MDIDFKIINSDKGFEKRTVLFTAERSPSVTVERTYFDRILDSSCINILEWSCFLTVFSCFFNACENRKGEIINFHNLKQGSQLFFSHCSSFRCRFKMNGICSIYDPLSSYQNEVSLCSFANTDNSAQALLKIYNGYVRIEDSNLTNNKMERDLIYLNSSTNAFVSFCRFAGNTVLYHGIVTFDFCPGSICSCSFTGTEGIDRVVHLYRGPLAIISLSNFVGVEKRKTFFIGEDNTNADAHIVIAGCRLEGESPEEEKVRVIDQKDSLVVAMPHSFGPVLIIRCTGKNKKNVRLLGIYFLFFGTS